MCVLNSCCRWRNERWLYFSDPNFWVTDRTYRVQSIESSCSHLHFWDRCGWVPPSSMCVCVCMSESVQISTSLKSHSSSVRVDQKVANTLTCRHRIYERVWNMTGLDPHMAIIYRPHHADISIIAFVHRVIVSAFILALRPSWSTKTFVFTTGCQAVAKKILFESRRCGSPHLAHSWPLIICVCVCHLWLSKKWKATNLFDHSQDRTISTKCMCSTTI